MKIRTSLLLSLLALPLLTGCGKHLMVDTSFAHTNGGLVNSGYTQIGALYYVDFATGVAHKLVEVDTSTFKSRVTSEPTTNSYGNLRGMGFTATPKALASVPSVRLAVAQQTRVDVENFETSALRNPIRDIAEDFRQASRDDGDPWMMAAAADNPRGFHFLISEGVRAEKANIYFGDKEGSENGLTLTVGKVGEFGITFTQASNNKWSGKGTPVFIRGTWFKIYRRADGTLGFRRNPTPTLADLDALPDILRHL
ncbi:hypothetical protein ACRC7T_04115 [Segnochrobactraceae bacterium EtOH-i3]